MTALDDSPSHDDAVLVDSLRLGLPILYGVTMVVAVVARRRLPPRSAAWTWAVSLPIAMIPVSFMWLGFALSGRAAPLGLVFIAGGLLFLAIWLVMTHRAVARVQAARTDGETEAALDEPLVEMSLVWAGLLLVGALVAVVVIIVVGVALTAG